MYRKRKRSFKSRSYRGRKRGGKRRGKALRSYTVSRGGIRL